MEKEKKYSRLVDFDPYNPLPKLKKEDVKKHLDIEDCFIGSTAPKWRCVAIGVIFQRSESENLDSFIPYLALNYLDRYVSKYGHHSVPIIGAVHKPNDSLLFMDCCYRLAWKMMNNNFRIPSLRAVNEDFKNISERHIHNMELHILKKLDWEMRPVMPFCFVPEIEPKLHLSHSLKRKTINEIIIHTSYNMHIARHNPSVIAASALLTASYFLYRRRFPSLVLQILSEGFEEVSLRKCTEGMIEMCGILKLVIQGTDDRRVRADRRRTRSPEEVQDQEAKEEEDAKDTDFGFGLKWKRILVEDRSRIRTQ